MTWSPGTWLELAYMEHLPMLHVAGEVFAGVFGLREFSSSVKSTWKVTHLPTGLSMGHVASRAAGRKLVDLYVSKGSIEFWLSIKKQPERATSSPETIAIIQACADARREIIK